MTESLLQFFGLSKESIDFSLLTIQTLLEPPSFYKACLPLCYLQKKEFSDEIIFTLISNCFQEGITQREISQLISQVQNSELSDENKEKIVQYFSLSEYQSIVYEIFPENIFLMHIEKDAETFLSSVEKSFETFSLSAVDKISLHISKELLLPFSMICRTISTPRRHAILVGGNSAGRYSLARFAAHHSEYEFLYFGHTSPQERVNPAEKMNS